MVVGSRLRRRGAEPARRRRPTRSTCRSRPVVLKVTSRDVIHSFWAPNLQGKRDLIPGYTTAIWMQADQPGVFRGQCAEFCGLQHAHMAFDIVAEPEADFERWLDGHAPAGAAAADERSQRRGRDVFMASRCAGCHTIRGTAAHGQVAPGPDAPRDAQHARRRHAAEHAGPPARLGARSAGQQARQPDAAQPAAGRRSAGAARLSGDAAMTPRRSSCRTPDEDLAMLERTWADPRGLRRLVSRTSITSRSARRYLVTAFAFFLLGGVLAALMRLQLARPDNTLHRAGPRTTRSSPRTARR